MCVCQISDSLLMRINLFFEDELALLFTGSKAPAGSHAKPPPFSECSTDPEGDDTVIHSSDPLSSIADPELALTEQTPALPIQSQEPQIHPLLYPSPGPDLSVLNHPSDTLPLPACFSHPLFSINQIGVDRRLIVNRKRKVKMYRVWVQGVFKKIQLESSLAMRI